MVNTGYLVDIARCDGIKWPGQEQSKSGGMVRDYFARCLPCNSRGDACVLLESCSPSVWRTLLLINLTRIRPCTLMVRMRFRLRQRVRLNSKLNINIHSTSNRRSQETSICRLFKAPYILAYEFNLTLS